MERAFQVIVIGGGHAGIEAAWAAANLFTSRDIQRARHAVALVTIDPAKVGVMSCNPAIGGLAKGQLVREIDAMGGVMGLVADASGINFKVLNSSKGPAVRGPRCQNDKHAYADAARAMIEQRPEIGIIAGTVDELLINTVSNASVTRRRCVGVRIRTPGGVSQTLVATAVVLTTGTFMRGLMHTGESKTPGGRFGEAAAEGISASLREAGFELGRLKTGTPPRLKRSTIDWESLPPMVGDEPPVPFSDLSGRCEGAGVAVGERFPVLPQVDCRQTRTTAATHDLIRANLHRAPMYSGQIESMGPRYCPSIEDKVVRFAERDTHGVFLEPESLRDDWVYCNGISTSLPGDVQDAIVRAMPGCERAEIYRYGYAVEYDMVLPHQIHASGEAKAVRGLFLAGQINGTSGYEEAAAQGLVAGVNAALRALGEDGGGSSEEGGRPFVMARDEAYIGVLMDDLVTKTPREPYRMFTSRAEHRLLLRADNAAERLTPRAIELGLLSGTTLGARRAELFAARSAEVANLNAVIDGARVTHDGASVELSKRVRMQGYSEADLARDARALSGGVFDPAVVFTVLADRLYEHYVKRAMAEIKRQRELEPRRIPEWLDVDSIVSLRTEARHAIARFRPATFGQASRLEGITPADMVLLSVAVERARRERAASSRRAGDERPEQPHGEDTA